MVETNRTRLPMIIVPSFFTEARPQSLVRNPMRLALRKYQRARRISRPTSQMALSEKWRLKSVIPYCGGPLRKFRLPVLRLSATFYVLERTREKFLLHPSVPSEDGLTASPQAGFTSRRSHYRDGWFRLQRAASPHPEYCVPRSDRGQVGADRSGWCNPTHVSKARDPR